MTYDVLIIGSGPGGYAAAVRASQYGLKTAVVEKNERLGGTCLLVGCIPTKALLHYAEVYDHVAHSEEIGISHKDVKVDFARMKERKDGIVSKHSGGIGMLFKKYKIDRIAGYGKLLGKGRVEVSGPDGAREVSAKNIILATGSEARMLPGLAADPERILTNIEILNLTKIPKSLAVIGAGAVGVEFASIFRTFGTEVTVIEMLPRLVPIEDEEISAELGKAFRKRGIACHTGAKVEKVVNGAKGVDIEFKGSDGKVRKLSAEKLLVAVGRRPNTEKIGLENTKIKTDREFVKVNEWMQTDEPGVWAIGDIVAGSPQLAHVASMEGFVAVARIAGKDVQPINYRQSPSVTFCEPQIGAVGLTEAKARESGYKVKAGKFSFAANSKASILGRHGGFVKVVADEEYGEIFGVHIIGPSATELISEAVTAISSEATVESMMYTIHAHPTLAEAVQDGFNRVYGLSVNS